MSVPDATENRVLDALLTIVRRIGTPSSAWLTSPQGVVDGVPRDTVKEVADGPRLYVALAHVAEIPEESTSSTHRVRASFGVWCAARDARTMVALKADVLRAVFAAEAEVRAAFNNVFWPGTFEPMEDLQPAGIYMGAQTLTIDVDVTHSAP